MTDAAKQPKRQSRRNHAYDSFTEHLLARDILPGQFISQRELVDITGMSLGAIRELVPRLEADGLITTVPQRGMQIAHIDLDLVRNAFQLRIFLELEAIKLFTTTASNALLVKLRQDHEEIIEAAKHDITTELLERAQNVDWAFHDCIIDSLENAIISSIYKVNSIKIRLIRQERFRLNENLLRTVMQDHLKIIDCLEERAPDKVVNALRQHLENARGRALGLGEM